MINWTSDQFQVTIPRSMNWFDGALGADNRETIDPG